MSDEKLKGEVSFPRNGEQARRQLDELASTSHLPLHYIENSWKLAIELAHISMGLLGIEEDGSTTRDLNALPSDLDRNTARRLLGTEVDDKTINICQAYIERLPLLLLGDRRASGKYATKTGWFAAAIAPYLYEMCKLVVDLDELTPQTWALSEMAFGLDTLPVDNSTEWEQLRDKWRKRKEGDKDIPLATLTRDLGLALHGGGDS